MINRSINGKNFFRNGNQKVNCKVLNEKRGEGETGSFKQRLETLMQLDGYHQPYKWAKVIGIKGGLFQYYWQKGKIPTVKNLLKIQNHAGCSIDWLLIGRGNPFEQLLSFFHRGKKKDDKARDFVLFESLIILKTIFRNDSSGDKLIEIKKFLTSLT